MIRFAEYFTADMMNSYFKQTKIYLILLMFTIGCSSGPDALGKLDLKKWRSDRNACKDIRAGLLTDFKAEQKQLLGKFIDEIGSILGRPDIHQLGERNTKFYIYFLQKGPQCDDVTKNSPAKKVVLKFNAIGLLSEITYQETPL